MTEYGRGPGSEPWHPEDPLYGDGGWEGQQAHAGQQSPTAASRSSSIRAAAVRSSAVRRLEPGHGQQDAYGRRSSSTPQQYAAAPAGSSTRSSRTSSQQQYTGHDQQQYDGPTAAGRRPAPHAQVPYAADPADPYGQQARGLRRRPAGLLRHARRVSAAGAALRGAEPPAPTRPGARAGSRRRSRAEPTGIPDPTRASTPSSRAAARTTTTTTSRAGRGDRRRPRRQGDEGRQARSAAADCACLVVVAGVRRRRRRRRLLRLPVLPESFRRGPGLSRATAPGRRSASRSPRARGGYAIGQAAEGRRRRQERRRVRRRAQAKQSRRAEHPGRRVHPAARRCPPRAPSS